MDEVGDYELTKEYYDRAVRFLGVTPTLDVFATCRNTKCNSFLALPGRGAEGARALDALAYSWRGEIIYAFPPVQIIPRVLQKIRLERLKQVLMVFPEWPSRPWWNLLQSMVVQQVRLGPSDRVLLPGPTLAANRAKIPPGSFIMALLSCRQ
jgi:hypothetical protein